MGHLLTGFEGFQATSSPPSTNPDQGYLSSATTTMIDAILWRSSLYRVDLGGSWSPTYWSGAGAISSRGNSFLAARFPATTIPPDSDFYNENQFAFRLNEGFPNHLLFSMYVETNDVLADISGIRAIHPDYDEYYLGVGTAAATCSIPAQTGAGPSIFEDYSTGTRYFVVQNQVFGEVTLYPENPYSTNPTESYSFVATPANDINEVGAMEVISGVGSIQLPLYSITSDLSLSFVATTTKTLSYGGAWNNDGTHT